MLKYKESFGVRVGKLQRFAAVIFKFDPRPVAQPEECHHVWSDDGERCLTGCTTEPYPAIDEWEQPVCCEKCGETALLWIGFELDRGGKRSLIRSTG